MAKALGIDIGWHAVKVAVVDGGPKGARLVRFAEVPYEGTGDADEAQVVTALRRALAEARGPKQAASYALPAEQCILREITVPFETDDQIAKIIKFEFEPHLHHGAIEDVVLDFVRTGPARSGSRVLCIAALKTLVRTQLERLTQVGIDPLHLDVDTAAIFNAAKHSGAFDAHPNCLIIDIGARTTKALAIRDGQLRVARSIRLGSKGVEKRLEADFQGDREAARRALQTSVGAEALSAPAATGPTTLDIVNSVREIEAAVASAVQDDFLSRVLRETQRTLPSVGDEKPPTRVFLTGGGARHPRARERIATHFGIEVEDLPVLAKLDPRMPPSEAEKIAATGAVAIGTALKVVGIDSGGIDLRQEDFKFARTFDRTKTALAVGATLMFFGVFLFLLTAHLRWKKLDSEAGLLQRAIAKELEEDVFEAYQKQVPSPRKRPGTSTEPATYFKESRAYVTSIKDHLKNELGLTTGFPPIRSSLEAWSVVSEALKEARAKPAPEKVEFLLLKDERYFQERGEIIVIVGDLPDGDRIAKCLRLHADLIESAEPQAPKATKDGKQEITIKMKFKERKQESAGKDDAATEAAEVKPQ